MQQHMAQRNRPRCSTNGSDAPHERRGSVLVAVLVVVLLLSLGVYQFAEMMLIERQAAELAAREARARLCADSGVEYVAALLMNREEIGDENLYHNPEVFSGIPVQEAASTATQGYFSVVAAVEADPTAQQLRFGLQDESGRLNLNSIPSFKLEEVEERELLLHLPGMTHELADSILDWIDEDTQRREFGVESDYYEGLASPYPAKNGPLESLDELLLIRGVTRELLYGEDGNRNRLLDPAENDADRLPPLDNADGLLDPGWSAFLTVDSRESNRQSDGTPRIWLNNSVLTELYDELIERFDEDTARFIVAYRISGPADGEASSGTGEQRSGGGSSGLERLAEGLDLSAGGRYTIDSIYDLIDREVDTEVDGSRTTLTSPWTSDPSSLQQALPELMDALSPSQDPSIPGRININQARAEVLLGLPGMTEDVARGIASARMIGSGGEPLTDVMAARATTGWLVAEGRVDLETMRSLDRFLTSRGDVFRAQIVGHFDQQGPSVRLEVLLDSTEQPVRLKTIRDLSHLGPGYQLPVAAPPE